jgi:hypothetical protein
VKKPGFVLIATGIVSILCFVFADTLSLGQSKELGAAQILGIDFGVVLVLIGIGLFTVGWDGKLDVGKRVRSGLAYILGLPPTVWIVITFLTMYVLFFIFPVFFSKIKIQYFVKFIPDAWVTHIGFDLDMTLGRVSRWLTTKQSPYADAYYYPPITLLIFAPLLVFGYPVYYKISTIITLLSYFVSTGLIPFLISPKRNYNLVLLFFIAGLFSYGFQFELERGQYNVITFAICLLAIYLFHYHPKFRYFSYILFSLSVQLKLYPVIFTVMFITDWRDWKNNVKRIAGLGIFNFSLLFILGYQMFIDFVRNITGTQLDFQSSRLEDLSIKGFVYNLTGDGFGLIPANRLTHLADYATLIENAILVVCGLCLISVIIHAYVHKLNGLNPYLLGICTVEALIVPSASVDYKLPLIIAPIALIFCGLPTIYNPYKNFISAAIVIIASIAFWITLYPFTIKPYPIARNFPALFIILISITLLYFLTSGKFESNVAGET